jgi:hypothetical protein
LSFLYRNRKKGKRASAQRDRERVCARDGALLKLRLASVLKMPVGRRMNYFETSENQHIKIMFFLRNNFNGRRRTEKIHKDYGERNNILQTLDDIWYNNISLTFPIMTLSITAC